jgi:phospholipase C
MTSRRLSRRDVLAGGVGLGAAWMLSGCGSAGRGSSSATTALINHAASTCPAGSDLGAVEHVVIVMQENRSFDHYFGSYPGVRGFDDRSGDALDVFSQAWPGSTNGAGKVLPFSITDVLGSPQCAGNGLVPIHNWQPQHLSWDGGKMDGFVSTHAAAANDGPAQGPLVMGYYDRQDIPFHYALADAFTLCDSYHCSVIGPTMPNRHYLMSGMLDPTGSAGGPVLETPPVATAPSVVGSCSWTTMPEVLTDKNVSWKVYQAPGTSAGPGQGEALASGFNVLLYYKQFLADPSSQLYQNAFLPSWPDQFQADVKSGALPQVSWLLPPLAESEHPNAAPDNGEYFVSQVLGALTSNPDVWAKTVVFFAYDENGGFFDHVAPPTAPAGTAGEYVTANPLPASSQGVDGPIGLGFRVPAMVVSPFSRGGWINSDMFDHTSILRFLEQRFDVQAPNLSEWRRQTVGDLTTTLNIAHPDTSFPSLPPTVLAPASNGTDCPTPTDLGPILGAPQTFTVPSNQQMPTQEPGAAKRQSC